MVKKLTVFYIKPPFLANYAKKSDKTLLDWVRPPPLWSKKSEYFLIRIFCFGRDPPPLLTESKKKPVFFFMPPLTVKQWRWINLIRPGPHLPPFSLQPPHPLLPPLGPHYRL